MTEGSCPAGATGAATADQPGVTTRTAGTARPPAAAVAVHPAAVAAGPTGGADPTASAAAAVADQPGGPTGTAGHPGVAPGRAIAAAAVQDSASTAGLPRRRPVGAVADQ